MTKQAVIVTVDYVTQVSFYVFSLWRDWKAEIQDFSDSLAARILEIDYIPPVRFTHMRSGKWK